MVETFRIPLWFQSRQRFDFTLFAIIGPYFQALVITEDKLDAFLFGINLQSDIKRFAALGGHAFYLHGFTFHKVFILFLGKGHVLDFLGNRHLAGMQSDDLIRRRVDGNIETEGLAMFKRHFDAPAEIIRNEELLFFFGRKPGSHMEEVKLRFFRSGWMVKPISPFCLCRK